MTDIQTLLSEYDFIIAIDVSGSMGETDMPGGRSRWEYIQEKATAICHDVEKLDSNGIDIVLFGGVTVSTFENVTTSKIKEVFASRSPRGSTPLAEALSTCLILSGKSGKKDFIIVFTDGVPDDAKAAERILRDASNAIESDDRLTILFVQVGRDVSATTYLSNLDNQLKGAKFDIVDLKTMDELEHYVTTAEMVAAAIAD